MLLGVCVYSELHQSFVPNSNRNKSSYIVTDKFMNLSVVTYIVINHSACANTAPNVGTTTH